MNFPSLCCLSSLSEEAVLGRKTLVKSGKVQQISSWGRSLPSQIRLSSLFLNKTCHLQGSSAGIRDAVCREPWQEPPPSRTERTGGRDWKPSGGLGVRATSAAAPAGTRTPAPRRQLPGELPSCSPPRRGGVCLPPIPCTEPGRAPRHAAWCRPVASASQRPWRKSARFCLWLGETNMGRGEAGAGGARGCIARAGQAQLSRGLLPSRQPERVREGAAREIVLLFLEPAGCAHTQRDPRPREKRLPQLFGNLSGGRRGATSRWAARGAAGQAAIGQPPLRERDGFGAGRIRVVSSSLSCRSPAVAPGKVPAVAGRATPRLVMCGFPPCEGTDSSTPATGAARPPGHTPQPWPCCSQTPRDAERLLQRARHRHLGSGSTQGAVAPRDCCPRRAAGTEQNRGDSLHPPHVNPASLRCPCTVRGEDRSLGAPVPAAPELQTAHLQHSPC